MKRHKRFACKVLFLVTLLAFAGTDFVFSAPKKEKKNKKNKNTEQVEEQPAVQPAEPEEAGVKLPSNTKPRTFFYKIEDDIIAGVENGSPFSIKNAVTRIKKTDGDYLDNEKVLIFIATSIMEIVWPSEKITWEKVEAPEDNPYAGAIKSARNGVFDSSTGNVDFLTTLLPALVILNNTADLSVYESCENAVKAALELKADSVLANYIMACVYEKKRNFDSAEKYLETAYNASKETDEIGLAYSRVLRNNGKLELASSILGGISGGSNDIAVLKQNAFIAFDSKDYDAAELYVARVLQQTPNDLEFLLFRAKILIEKNDYIHAVSLLDMYARQNDTNIDYLILRARVQLDWSKNTTAATETIEKAMQLYPDNVEAILIAAKISSATDGPVAGKYADELAAIVLEKSPSNIDAQIYALDGLIQRENWQEAYQISSNLMKTQGDNENLILKHVTVCLKLRKNSEAMELAQKAYNANPSSEVITQTYILASTQVLSRDESLKLIDSMLPSASSKMKSYLYYRKSFLERSEDSALADLRSSLIANPRNSESLFRLYEIYFDKKDYRKAQYYLKQVVAINPNDSSYKRLNEALTQLVQ